MSALREMRILWVVSVLLAVGGVSAPAQAKYGGGSGTADDPYQIWTAEQMNAIGAEPNDWDKHFQLMADIDLSAFDGQEGRPAFNTIGTSRPRTRTRVLGVASDAEGRFTGVFDGDGRTITNFTMSSSSDDGPVGLFRHVSGRETAIKNLRLLRPTLDAGRTSAVGALVGYLQDGTITGCHVETGAITGKDYVGGLAGDLWRGNVTDCHVKDATIIGGPFVDGDRVGGLAGYLREGTITDCHVENGTIIGSDYVGGLVGDCNATTAADCHATGIVIGNDHVGGLCGTGPAVRCFAEATVLGHDYVGGLLGDGGAMNCYATGTVMGNTYVGGLVGYASEHFWYGHGLSPVAIANSYAACLVVGDALAANYPASVWIQPAGLPPFPGGGQAFVGGLAGFIRDNHSAFISDGSAFIIKDVSLVIGSFWDTGVSGQPTSAGGEGRTTVQMQTATTFRTWNTPEAASVWTLDEGRDYPRLAWEGRPGAPIRSGLRAGSGTPDDPYLIYTAEDLWFLTQSLADWDKCFKLMADLDVAEYARTGLPSIGFWAEPFTGVFDGNGHTISGYVNTTAGGGGAGLFGLVNRPAGSGREPSDGAVIKNLGLIDPLIDGRTIDSPGALVSSFERGVIAGCYVKGGLVVGLGTGGLVGRNNGTIRDCYASTRVIGPFAGGLVGYNRGHIVNCYSTSVVLGGDYTGGLVGRGEGELGMGSATGCFWDTETSDQTTSAGGAGNTTAAMQTAKSFSDSGWDFAGETTNGTKDIWWIDEGKDYPRLWWEAAGE